MKGTFFSADFVIDKNENLRLIEINTDTGAVESQMSSFDWSDFIGVLSGSNITELDVLYKIELQQPIINHLSQSLIDSASFITTFNPIVVPESSIFPTSPDDAPNKFILRMAYDETAILDSEYAKGTLNTLKLFADNSDSNSVTAFYHSSSLYGNYNTLDTTIFNGDVLPDVVTKTVLELHQPHQFYKIGNSISGSLDRYNEFINTVATPDTMIEQYHIDQSQITNNTVNSIRSFQIVYNVTGAADSVDSGSETATSIDDSGLQLCYVSQYQIDSLFTLPTSINYDDSVINNLIDSKHYYEFATNHIKNSAHGILDNEYILDISGNSISVTNLVIGDEYQSYHIEGIPETDNYDLLDTYFFTGNTLPSGSFQTGSTCVALYTNQSYANDGTYITFADGSDIEVGGETQMLVYNPTTDETRFVRALDLELGYSVLGESSFSNQITSIDVLIYDDQQTYYIPSMDPYDNFILESGNFMSFFITHNLGTCFVAGTKVTLEGGSTKNIEEIEEGDEVLSYNENTLMIEPKKVIGLNSPVHNDLVTYTFSNDTQLTCTFDHPIYVNGLGLASFIPEWTNNRYKIDKDVKKIQLGDLVRLATGGQTAIKEIRVLKPEDTQTYIITVQDNHNFFANNILVHNK